MLVYNAAVKKAEGMSIDQLSEWLLNNRLNVCQWFTVDDLGHLKRGGRVSAIASVVGTMLGVKPVLHVNNEGRLIPVTKARGRKKSLEALVERMELTCINPQEQVIFIGHGDCLDDAKLVENMIREKMKVKDVVINHIGTVIGSHSGPGTVALFFLARKDNKIKYRKSINHSSIQKRRGGFCLANQNKKAKLLSIKIII